MDEDELALLEQQREFMNSGLPAAASVVRKAPNTQRKPSRFAQQQAAKKQSTNPPESSEPPSKPIENPDEDILSKVLSDVVEKNTSTQTFSPPVLSAQVAFPEARHRSVTKANYQKIKAQTQSIKRDPEQEKLIQQVDQTLQNSTPEKPLVSIQVELPNDVKIPFDSLEEQKLKWTDEIPKEEQSNNSDSKPSWRFNLDGELMNDEEPENQYHSELYHHGKDPDKPGYTVEELLYLTRSTVPNQRSIAFNILSRIIRNAKALKINVPVMETLVGNDIAIYIRSGMDDHYIVPQTAAINCMHALLISPADHIVANEQLICCYGKDEQLPLNPGAQEPSANDDDESLAKRDVLLAFVTKMTGIQRVRYLAEALSTPRESVIQTVQILHRCICHSRRVAEMILEVEFLQEYLMESFLSNLSEPSDELRQLLLIELARSLLSLCKASKINAKKLLTRNFLNELDRVTQFLPRTAQEQSSLQFDNPRVKTYVYELFSLGLRYEIILVGDYYSEEDFPELFPNLFSLEHLETWNFHSDQQLNESNSKLVQFNNQIRFLVSSIPYWKRTYPQASFPISNSLGLISKWISKFLKFSCELEANEYLLGIIGNLFALQAELLQISNQTNVQSSEELAKELGLHLHFSGILEQFQLVVSELTQSSDSIKFEVGYPNNALVEFYRCDLVYTLVKAIRRHLLIQFIRVLQIAQQLAPNILEEDLLVKFKKLGEISLREGLKTLHQIRFTSGQQSDRNIFLHQFRSRVMLNYFLMQIFIDWRSNQVNRERLQLRVSSLYWFGLQTLSSLYSGQEWFVEQLFRRLIFDPKTIYSWIESSSFASEVCEKLHVQSQMIFQEIQALSRAFDRFISPSNLSARSEQLYKNGSQESCFLPVRESVIPLSFNWWTMPLRFAYEDNAARQAKAGKSSNPEPIQLSSAELDELVKIVRCCLLYTGLLISQLPRQEYFSGANRGLLYAELVKCYLLPEQVYQNEVVYKLLEILLPQVLGKNERVLFPERAYSLLRELVEEYGASSFGNELFSNYLLFFMQMHHPKEFRKLVVREIGTAFRFFRPAEYFPWNEEFYYSPIETDDELMENYLELLCPEHLTQADVKDSFLLSFATHHIAARLFGDFVNLSPSEQLSTWKKSQFIASIPKHAYPILLGYWPHNQQVSDEIKNSRCNVLHPNKELE